MRADVPDDLQSIVSFLDEHSEFAGDRFIASVFPAMEDLAAMPGKGSPKHFRSKRLEGVRSWSVPKFRKFLILYRPITDGIEVLAVAHGSRDLRKVLLGRTGK
jgi:plasmid stabilization system protein ParE